MPRRNRPKKAYKRPRSPEQEREVQELRRSNAATPIPSKRIYRRKRKYPKHEEES